MRATTGHGSRPGFWQASFPVRFDRTSHYVTTLSDGGVAFNAVFRQHTDHRTDAGSAKRREAGACASAWHQPYNATTNVRTSAPEPPPRGRPTMSSSIESPQPHPVSPDERAEYLEFACRLAEMGGDSIVGQFRRSLAVDNKTAGAGYDPVTEADRAAERAMREAIRERYPGHGILGEEFGHHPGEGLTWVLDPIDGTRGFVMGLLHWGTLVALFDGQRPVVGAIHQAVLGETFAGDGTAAVYTRGGERHPLATRPCSELCAALAGSTAPELFRTDAQAAAFDRIRRRVRGMRYGTDCYLYAMLAMGHADLVIEAGLKPYDVQALIPVVEGAGGVITDWSGGNPAMGGEVIATGDARLHELALTELRG